jgi:diguanylate cyclase (GGDEF)-like protein/PAS domain S-box-containing protein
MVFRKNPVDQTELRQIALERLRQKGVSAAVALDLPGAQRLFEELEIHQIELELQNEHLSQARAQLEAALNQSTELYDFSPVGNLLLDGAGSITKVNLSGAQMLGTERARLLGSKLGLYWPEAERQGFNELLSRSKASGEVVAGELTLLDGHASATHVQIHVSPLSDESGWQIVLVDISERRRMEAQLRLSEQRWNLALDATGDGVWDWNLSTDAVLFSKRFIELHGYSESEFGQRKENWFDRIHPEDKPHVMMAVQDCLGGESSLLSSEYRVRCKDGRWKWVLARGAVIARGEDRKPLRMIGTYVDISGRKEVEEALRLAANFQQAVFDSLSAQVAVLDRLGVLIQTNLAWKKYVQPLAGQGAQVLVDVPYLDVLYRLTQGDQGVVQRVKSGLDSVLAGEMASFQLQQPFFVPADKHWLSMKVTPVHDVQERLLVSHEDVTSLKAAELASTTLANVDALTGALSRLNFLNLAEQELQRSTRYSLPLMVLMMDLDHFKQINDQHGHAAGDAVLKQFVQTVSAVLRDSDLMGRLGGEEFGVLLPNTTVEGGRALAQRIIDNVQSSPVLVHDKRIVYTVSIGAGCLSSENSFSALLGVADLALYRAKNGGRNRLELGGGELPA